MSRQKWITKAEIKEILKMYSVRPDEFEHIEKLECHYKSKYAKGYVIAINPEELKGKNVTEQTGRILVQHCTSSGDIMHTDIWERTRDGNKMQFLCRQEKGNLPDSAAYVNDLREELERLQRKNKDLQQLLDANMNKTTDADAAEQGKLLDTAINQRDYYKELYQNLKKEMDKKKENVGRKKRGETDASREVLETVRNVLNNDPENKEPWKTIGIGRATYFRYKKLVQDEK